MRGYKLLTHDDRKTIERMYAAGAKPHLIAEAVGSTLATVYRELQRGAPDVQDSDYRPMYSAEIAEERVRLNMSNRGRRRKTVT